MQELLLLSYSYSYSYRTVHGFFSFLKIYILKYIHYFHQISAAAAAAENSTRVHSITMIYIIYAAHYYCTNTCTVLLYRVQYHTYPGTVPGLVEKRTVRIIPLFPALAERDSVFMMGSIYLSKVSTIKGCMRARAHVSEGKIRDLGHKHVALSQLVQGGITALCRPPS